MLGTAGARRGRGGGGGLWDTKYYFGGTEAAVSSGQRWQQGSGVVAPDIAEYKLHGRTGTRAWRGASVDAGPEMATAMTPVTDGVTSGQRPDLTRAQSHATYRRRRGFLVLARAWGICGLGGRAPCMGLPRRSACATMQPSRERHASWSPRACAGPGRAVRCRAH